MRNLLAGIGILALLGTLVVSLGALAIVGQRVRVVVSDDSGAPSPELEQIALLRDDTQRLQADLGALAEALQGSFASQARLQAELEHRLADIRAAAGEGATGTGAATPERPATEPAGDPVEAASSPSFLAFELPSRSFRFDARQRFELLPDLSRVGFDAKSTLHDFSGVTSDLEGSLLMNLARPQDGCSGEIRVAAQSLATGLAARDDSMREHLDVGAHPRITFRFEGFEAEQVDTATETLRGRARGGLTIRGVTRPIEMPVRIGVDASRRVEVEGELSLSLADYAVPVPSQAGLIEMDPVVRVWIALRARAAPAAEGESGR